MNVKGKFISEEAMSCKKSSGDCYDTSSPAPKELRDLAGLEVRKRRLLRELAIVEYQHRQLVTRNRAEGHRSAVGDES